MKRFSIWFNDLGGEDGFTLLESASSDLDIIDRGQFYLCDMVTNARVLSSNDEISFSATPEQETILRLRFGDKICNLND